MPDQVNLTRKATLLMDMAAAAAAQYGERRQMSLIHEDPLMLDKLRAEAGHHSPLAPKTLQQKSSVGEEKELQSRDLTETITRRRQHLHLQSADLFDYFSPVQKQRQKMRPIVSDAFGTSYTNIAPLEIPELISYDTEELRTLFPNISNNMRMVQIESSQQRSAKVDLKPLTIGIVLSGGPAPGGHNVIAGVYDYVTKIDARGRVLGFKGGLDGLFNNEYVEITKSLMDRSRNSGGFDMIWSGRGMVTESQKPAALKAVTSLNLDGLIIVGGDGSNSNAALLAEYLAQEKCKARVIGVPKTIDGDLKNAAIECSFGFDTAAKTYSELIGNLCTDCSSGLGVWHFVRVMGRSASHLVVECAMQTRPNLLFVGEEVEAKNMTMRAIVEEIADLITERRAVGKNYGIILVPEGLIGFIPEMKKLIEEMSHQICSNVNNSEAGSEPAFDPEKLTEASRNLWKFLPAQIQQQLLTDREASGYVQVAKIATERLLMQLVEDILEERGCDVKTWNRMHHYFGYEGRCAMPSNFDANYCYNLGMTAATLCHHNYTGYMAIVKDLDQEASLWTPAGVPFVKLMRMLDLPMGRGPGIIRQLVDIESPSFKVLSQVRPLWKMGDYYRSPGPIQFMGPVADISNYTVEAPTKDSLLAGTVENLTTFTGVGRAETPRRLGCYSELQQLRVLWRPPVPEICSDTRAGCVRGTQYLPKDPYIRRQTLSFCPNLCKDNEFHLQEVRIKSSETKFVSIPSFRQNSGAKCFRNERQERITTSPPRMGIRIGVVFISRHSPGQQNILWGVYERVKLLEGTCLGFKKGAAGLLQNDFIEITDTDIQPFRNLGGSDLLGRGNAHVLLEHENQKQVLAICTQNSLDGLVIVGSSLAMTEAAYMAEYFRQKNSSTSIIGVPATASNNVAHELIEANIGFDTASKLYSSLIGNVLTDAASMPKYWHFVRIMGRQPSNEVLECALQTHPNCVVIAEEYGASQKTLDDVVQDIADVVCARAEVDRDHPTPRNFGAVIIPDGLWHHLPTMKLLLQNLDRVMAAATREGEEAEAERELLEMSNFQAEEHPKSKWASKIAPWSAAVWRTLPAYIQREFLTTNYELRDSYVETQVLIAQLVAAELRRRKEEGRYRGNFQSVCHYFGYQGRSALPSNFDATLGFVHGHLAAICVEAKVTGHLTTVRGLCNDVNDWKLGAIPFNCLLTLVPQQQNDSVHPQLSSHYREEQRPVIPNAETDLNSKALRWLMVARENWSSQDRFCNPGPIQFWGAASKFYHRILHEEQAEYSRMLRHVQKFADILRDACDFGVEEEFLKFAYASLNSLLTLRFQGDLMMSLTPSGGVHGSKSFAEADDSGSDSEGVDERENTSYHRLPSKSDWKRSFIG